MQKRKCNCDARDSEERTDAGVLSQNLPIKTLNYAEDPLLNNFISIGSLYCLEKEHVFDECSMEFHDCHVHAKCVNRDKAFSCQCNVGWQALGVENEWANGRQCFDDDECALNKCPFTSTCTNTPGSYTCQCNVGFRHINPFECEDINECAEGVHNCHNDAKCHNTFGSFFCTCKDGFKGDGVQCEEFGSCKFWGDPHGLTFDKNWLHFQGSCSYVMATDACGDQIGEPLFRIIQNNWKGTQEKNGDYSWIREVHLHTYGHIIKLTQDKKVIVDNILVQNMPVTPFVDHPDLVISNLARYLTIYTPYGVTVKWSGVDKVIIELNKSWKSRVCGLCGNFNNNQTDDFITGDKCPEHGVQTLTNDPKLFGNSWLWEANSNNTHCVHDCHSPNKIITCPEEFEIAAVEYCQQITSATGRFQECVSEFDQEELIQLQQSCVFDMCQSGNDVALSLCPNAEMFVSRCQQDFKVEINEWRSHDFCPITCKENQEYKTCVPTCQATCVDQSNENCLENRDNTTGVVSNSCYEGCVCLEGYVRDGDGTCVEPHQCGCERNKFYYKINDHFVDGKCESRCSCEAYGMNLTCVPLQCDMDADCLISDQGVLDCYCQLGYQGNGVQCNDVDECSLNTHNCHQKATCTNTKGSFVCTCINGYHGDGVSCLDNDECAMGTDTCVPVTEYCLNNMGSYTCICETGYTRNASNICVDVDECTSNREQCHRRSTQCRNIQGGYECDCKNGFSRYSDLRCKDINECVNATSNNCHLNATCYNSVGTFSCSCKAGFKGDGVDCIDVNECSNTNWNDCDAHASCNNTVGSYECSCNTGYSGTGLDCDDINECTQENDCIPNSENGKCVNNIGSYTCTCVIGFSLQDGVCVDVNECIQSKPCGRNSTCTNGIGSYTCQCIDKFAGNSIGKECKEIPTCTNDLMSCDEPHSVCVDDVTLGSMCKCQEGYQEDQNGDCKDINECLDEDNCDGSQQYCINTDGYFTCDCEHGYQMDEMQQCKDVDECENMSSNCQSNSTSCRNILGSFICDCKDGFDNSDGIMCHDIDECVEVDLLDCDSNADCKNTIGSYTCVCKQGFTGDDKQCSDIHECTTNQHNCNNNADCNELEGSFSCQCHDGFEGNGVNCQDINECLRNLHNCGNDTKCVNTAGAFRCECNHGFNGHCDNCLDIDECITGQDRCDEHAECSNTHGSYSCECFTGYMGDGKTCNDQNECVLGTHGCNIYGDCVNSQGSFYCICYSGYKLVDNNTCIDIDECSSQEEICSKNAQCTNDLGSYTCICKEGYIGDGIDCTSSDPTICGNRYCSAHAECNVINDLVKECHCDPGYLGDGYEDGSNCTEINPCDTTICDENAFCSSSNGRAFCRCVHGYQGDGQQCEKGAPCDDIYSCGYNAICTNTGNETRECGCPQGYSVIADYDCYDIDECSEDIAMCQDNSYCFNTLGSYECICDFGFEQQNDSLSCTDIDECELDQHNCGSTDVSQCENTEGSFECSCLSPYIGDGLNCLHASDINCTLTCADNSYCVRMLNSDSIYIEYCECQLGMQDTDEGCIDIQECAEDQETCSENADCTEFIPGFMCECREGYEGSGQFCQDIDECKVEDNVCDDNALCSNIEGSFNCTCIDGYTGDGFTCSPFAPEDDICGCGVNGICKSESSRCICNPGYKLDLSRATDLCQDDDDCAYSGRCHESAICTDLIGSFVCSCPDNMAGDGYNYCDVNECLSNTHNCDKHATCVNDIGFYNCFCKKGFTGDGFTCEIVDKSCTCLMENSICIDSTCQCESGFRGDGELCVNIDECLENDNLCAMDSAECVDYDGGYTCRCFDGFRGDGRLCQDIDECIENRHSCSAMAECTNTIGGFTCKCLSGFHGDGIDCVPSNDCSNGCHSSARCASVAVGGLACVCQPGYQGDGHYCTDIDECNNNSTLDCAKEATCVNTVGSYECLCNEGYWGNGFYCEDTNECSLDIHSCNDTTQQCFNIIGSYECQCSFGYELLDDMCQDIDECKRTETNLCANNATCINTESAYRCTCGQGFYGNGLQCYDIDECQLGTADCNQNSLCVNTAGSFTCRCLQNFFGDGQTCNPIDDYCLDDELNECSENATCINQTPAYDCVCKQGFIGNGFYCIEKNPCNEPGICSVSAICESVGGKAVCTCISPLAGDGITCLPVNECEEETDNCDINAFCIDREYGFSCQCKAGYYGNGKICKDIDECDANSPHGGLHLCESSATCINSPVGSYTCKCAANSVASGQHGCETPNECKLASTNKCNNNTICHNTRNGFYCLCRNGYTKVDPYNCVDIDECKYAHTNCPSNSDCDNTKGSYTCVCREGYEMAMQTRSCIDVDECLLESSCPGNNTRCVNEKGSFRCICMPGYHGTAGNCSDIDECATNTDPCHEFAECSNTPGSCKCTCAYGYRGDGIHCEENDKCPGYSSNPCAMNGFCIINESLPMQLNCSCKGGFFGDGYQRCLDIDECSLATIHCHDKAKCSNIAGSFECECSSGYTGNGKTNCDDINECDDSPCSEFAECENILGGYNCQCQSGYQGDGLSCSEIDECSEGRHTCDIRTSICSNTVGSYVCQCLDGYRQSDNVCIDIDECVEGSDNCDRLSECIDTEGSFTCRCPQGYYGDGYTCTDIDECKDMNGGCALNSDCFNTAGSRVCRCKTGYKNESDICIDINECDEGIADCGDSLCINLQPSYRCGCGDGFILNLDNQCIDTNECMILDVNGIGICGNNTVCENLAGTCMCLCEKGFTTLEGDTCTECRDLDECTSNSHNCPADKMCVNKVGSYDCVCRSGFLLIDGVCVEIDECLTSPCKLGTCINTQGAYTCVCPDGFTFDGETCENINECIEPLHSEYVHQCNRAQCVDTPGSYQCNCWSGYTTDDNRKCSDINECLNENICGNFSLCLNTLSSYSCVCENGFKWNTDYCQDIDECAITPTICGTSLSAQCVNTIGSYTCICNVGFELTVFSKCTDIDECFEDNAICGNSELTCVNLEGSYGCICPPGYSNEAGKCINLDECSSGEHNCDPNNGECLDTIGSYTCKCKHGYRGNGRHCNPICQPGLCSGQRSCEVDSKGEATCACRCSTGDVKCTMNGRVCGSDGVTYPSYSELVVSRCRMDKEVSFDYDSSCKETCDEVICSNYAICNMVNGKPTCQCINDCSTQPKQIAVDNSEELCVFPFIFNGIEYNDCIDVQGAATNSSWCSLTSNYDIDHLSGNCIKEVCSSDGDTYDNYCEFKKQMCLMKMSDNFEHFAACQLQECVYGEYNDWSQCTESCGQGERSRWRSVLQGDARVCRDREQRVTCLGSLGACKGGACDEKACESMELCTMHDGLEPTCICEDCAYETIMKESKVCGIIDSHEMQTFNTLCHLRREACHQLRNYTLLHSGDCVEGASNLPLMCDRVASYSRPVDSQGCQASHEVKVNQCSGGCGKVTGMCCEPSSHRYQPTKMSCPDGREDVVSNVLIIEQCSCIKGIAKLELPPVL